MDLTKLMDGSEHACREVLAELRWPDGVKCPRCETGRHAYDSDRYVWDCYSCGYQFSALSGTIFHDTKLPLQKWFLAVFLMVEARKGINASQMKRALGVSYKTAWYLCHRIRAAMGSVEWEPLTGAVEKDETYIGGRRNAPRREDGINAVPKGYNSLANKQVVMGAVSRNVEEWAKGDVPPSTFEPAWSLLRRSIAGSYHQPSTKHLAAYLDEMEWRFNNRNNDYPFRDTLIRLVTAKALPYSELTT